jgi:hypothetical protein
MFIDVRDVANSIPAYAIDAREAGLTSSFSLERKQVGD